MAPVYESSKRQATNPKQTANGERQKAEDKSKTNGKLETANGKSEINGELRTTRSKQQRQSSEPVQSPCASEWAWPFGAVRCRKTRFSLSHIAFRPEGPAVLWPGPQGPGPVAERAKARRADSGAIHCRAFGPESTDPPLRGLTAPAIRLSGFQPLTEAPPAQAIMPTPSSAERPSPMHILPTSNNANQEIGVPRRAARECSSLAGIPSCPLCSLWFSPRPRVSASSSPSYRDSQFAIQFPGYWSFRLGLFAVLLASCFLLRRCRSSDS